MAFNPQNEWVGIFLCICEHSNDLSPLWNLYAYLFRGRSYRPAPTLVVTLAIVADPWFKARKVRELHLINHSVKSVNMGFGFRLCHHAGGTSGAHLCLEPEDYLDALGPKLGGVFVDDAKLSGTSHGWLVWLWFSVEGQVGDLGLFASWAPCSGMWSTGCFGTFLSWPVFTFFGQLCCIGC